MAREPKRASQHTRAAEQRVGAKLDALYAQLPSLDCKGKCWESCGPVRMSPGERDRILREAGVEIPPPEQMARDGCKTCPALKDRRCTVYEIRPMACRLWGTDESMRCPLGCEPDGGWIGEVEGVGFKYKSYLIGGFPSGVTKMTPKQVAEFLRRGEVPGVASMKLTGIGYQGTPTETSRNPKRRARRLAFPRRRSRKAG